MTDDIKEDRIGNKLPDFISSHFPPPSRNEPSIKNVNVKNRGMGATHEKKDPHHPNKKES